MPFHENVPLRKFRGQDRMMRMMTKVGRRGEIVIPKSIRLKRKIRAGEKFDVTADDDDFDLILLQRRRASANPGLLKHLMVCPLKGVLRAAPRRREAMREVRFS